MKKCRNFKIFSMTVLVIPMMLGVGVDTNYKKEESNIVVEEKNQSYNNSDYIEKEEKEDYIEKEEKENFHTIEYLSMNIPRETDGSFKTYMSYKSITNTNSEQWKLQQEAYTNNDGFRMIDGKYMIAIGTYYSKKCGEEFKITLSSGKEIMAIVGDIKQDAHTNATHQYVTYNGNIVEFIVDTEKISSLSKKMGDMSYSGLEGSIIKIEKLVQ